MFSGRKRRLILGVLFSLFVGLFVVGCWDDTSAESSSGGCGTTMGCCPATGCGRGWLGSSTQTCFNTSSECGAGGNSQCRQCY